MNRETPLNTSIQQYFGFARVPFSDGLKTGELYPLPSLVQVARSVDFAIDCDGSYAVIGEIGSGKSTALRYAAEKIRGKADVISMVAGSWGHTEFLRAVLSTLGLTVRSFMPAYMASIVREKLRERRKAGRKVAFLIDEAHLLRGDVFKSLHTLALDQEGGGSLATLVLCGQDTLSDKLASGDSAPLASRITDGYFMEPLTKEDFLRYFAHHLSLAKAPADLFDGMALDAIWTGSARNLRQIGMVSRKCLQRVANAGDPARMTVSAAIVREVSQQWWANAKLLGKGAQP